MLRARQEKEGFLVKVSAVQMRLTPRLQQIARFLDGLPDRMERRFNLSVAVIDAMRAEMEEERRRLRADLELTHETDPNDGQLALGA